MSNKTSLIGRRLRRYLGTLLAVGFGAAWWSFVPPARASAAPVAPVHAGPPPVAMRVRAVPAVATPIVHRPTRRVVTLHPQVHHPRPRPQPKPRPVIPPPPQPEPIPVVMPVLPDVPTPQPPVVELPVIDDQPLPDIRTRSSR